MTADSDDQVHHDWPAGGGQDGRWIHHRHDSYDAALADARTMTDRRMLVVRLVTEKGWH